LDALEILIENLRKECYAKFANKDEFDSLRGRVSALENKMRDVEEDQKNAGVRLNQCRDVADQNVLDIKDLKNKFD